MILSFFYFGVWQHFSFTFSLNVNSHLCWKELQEYSSSSPFVFHNKVKSLKCHFWGELLIDFEFPSEMAVWTICDSGTLVPLSSELFRAAHWLLLSLGEFTSTFSGSSSDSTHYSIEHTSLFCSLGSPSQLLWLTGLFAPLASSVCVSHILFKCLLCVIHRSCFCAMSIMLLV